MKYIRISPVSALLFLLIIIDSLTVLIRYVVSLYFYWTSIVLSNNQFIENAEGHVKSHYQDVISKI